MGWGVSGCEGMSGWCCSPGDSPLASPSITYSVPSLHLCLLPPLPGTTCLLGCRLFMVGLVLVVREAPEAKLEVVLHLVKFQTSTNFHCVCDSNCSTNNRHSKITKIIICNAYIRYKIFINF